MEIFKNIEIGNTQIATQLISRLLSANITQLPLVYQLQKLPIIDIKFTQSQETLLIYACKYNNADLIKDLLSKQPNTNISDVFGNTALLYSVCHNNIDIVKLLLDNGANINHKNSFGFNAFSYSIQKNYIDMMNYLLTHPVDVNCVDVYGNSPLLYAAANNNVDIMKILLDKGANPNVLNVKEQSVFSFSLDNDTLKFIISHNQITNTKVLDHLIAKINIMDNDILITLLYNYPDYLEKTANLQYLVSRFVTQNNINMVKRLINVPLLDRKKLFHGNFNLPLPTGRYYHGFNKIYDDALKLTDLRMFKLLVRQDTELPAYFLASIIEHYNHNKNKKLVNWSFEKFKLKCKKNDMDLNVSHYINITISEIKTNKLSTKILKSFHKYFPEITYDTISKHVNGKKILLNLKIITGNVKELTINLNICNGCNEKTDILYYPYQKCCKCMINNVHQSDTSNDQLMCDKIIYVH